MVPRYRIMLVDCWIKQIKKIPLYYCHLQFLFCSCVHCQFSVRFVLLIMYLCSLPVFSGVVLFILFLCSLPVFSGFVLLILYLCSLPVFSGVVLFILYLCSLPVFSRVCVIDSVSVFTASFQ